MLLELVRFGELLEAELASVRLLFLMSALMLFHLVNVFGVKPAVGTFVVFVTDAR